MLSLQQQVASMSSPVMAQHEALALPEELARLRGDLEEERGRRREAERQLQSLADAGPAWVLSLL